MTLCMAAVCYDESAERHRIVFCSDRRAETAWAGGDVAFKFAWARRNWPALIAGEPSKAQDFLATCRAAFMNDDEPFTRDNIYDKLNEVSSAHKEKLCRRYTRQSYGIDYDRVLTEGETALPADTRTRLFYQLADIEFGFEVLIFGFTERITPLTGEKVIEPHLMEIRPSGEVVLREGFAAIGTGAIIAKSTLYQREHTPWSTLEDTVYCLYEAARLAHKTAPSVGQISQFQILDVPADDTGLVSLTGTTLPCVTLLEGVFNIAGPKSFVPIDELPESCFEQILPLPEKKSALTSDEEAATPSPETEKPARPSKRRKSKGRQ